MPESNQGARACERAFFIQFRATYLAELTAERKKKRDFILNKESVAQVHAHKKLTGHDTVGGRRFVFVEQSGVFFPRGPLKKQIEVWPIPVRLLKKSGQTSDDFLLRMYWGKNTFS